MTETGLAAKEGTLQEGDLILKVNITTLTCNIKLLCLHSVSSNMDYMSAENTISILSVLCAVPISAIPVLSVFIKFICLFSFFMH